MLDQLCCKSEQMKWLWLTALILFVDQISKLYIVNQIPLHDSVAVINNINLVHVCNTGAAFSFLSDASGWQRWFFIGFASLVSGALFFWLLSLSHQQKILSCALALILGGAFGNLLDRLLVGCVVDFIQIYLSIIPLKLFNPWPVFNVADSAISIGALLLIVDTFLFDD